MTEINSENIDFGRYAPTSLEEQRIMLCYMNLEQNLSRYYVNENDRTEICFLDENSMLQPSSSKENKKEENKKYNLSQFKKRIDTLLQSETTISKGFRLFMADVFCGRIQVKKDSNVATLKRNLSINADISRYLAKGYKLTGENSASKKVADEYKISVLDARKDEYNISVDSVLDARKKAVKHYAEIEREKGVDFKKATNEHYDKCIEWAKEHPEELGLPLEEVINNWNYSRKKALIMYGKI